MNRSRQVLGVAVAAVTTAGIVTGIGGIGLAAADSATAITAVNIRSGPGTGYRIVGGLYRGQSLTRLASAQNGWVKVRFNGSSAYVASRYLSMSKNDLPAAPPTIQTTGTKTATTLLNVRASASLSAAVIGYVSSGQKVGLTGRSSGGYAEIVYGGERAWVSAKYLTGTASGLPRVTGTRVATTTLMIRSTSGSDFTDLGEVAKGTKLSVTGAVQNGRAQIVYAGAVRWVTAQYLANSAVTQPSTGSLPKVTGSRYATTLLNIRSSAAASYTLIGTAARGTKLSVTGVQSNGRAQIVYNGAVRWVTAQYLSTAKPTGSTSTGSTSTGSTSTGSTSTASYTVEKGLKPNAIKVHRAALTAFPAIKTYYGVRPDSIPDHPSGHALDLMLPYSNYTSAAAHAYGLQVANWARANAKALGIQYVIYDQHIWNIQRDAEGWRYMADRGSDSANHKNHVHITVY